jgi:hypothetical protein
VDIQYLLYGFPKNKNKVVAQHDLSAHAASIVDLPVLPLINHMYGFYQNQVWHVACSLPILQ